MSQGPEMCRPPGQASREQPSDPLCTTGQGGPDKPFHGADTSEAALVFLVLPKTPF